LLLNYHGAIGVKTGWTTKARGTFIGAATRNGHTLVATVLHTKFASWTESRALLAWGFANIDKARPVGSLNQIKQATQASSVRQSGTSTAKTSAKSTISAGHGLPLWAWVPIGLLIAVVALRTRVLLRQRAIRRRYPPRRAY
jgi:serine-type D-Ala-D-Ala carboxypeptidase (penicillin-binding protein 5/6)